MTKLQGLGVSALFLATHALITITAGGTNTLAFPTYVVFSLVGGACLMSGWFSE